MRIKRKFCKIVLNDSDKLAVLVKNFENTMTLAGIQKALKSEKRILTNTVFFETLKEVGYTEEEIKAK